MKIRDTIVEKDISIFKAYLHRSGRCPWCSEMVKYELLLEFSGLYLGGLCNAHALLLRNRACSCTRARAP